MEQMLFPVSEIFFLEKFSRTVFFVHSSKEPKWSGLRNGTFLDGEVPIHVFSVYREWFSYNRENPCSFAIGTMDDTEILKNYMEKKDTYLAIDMP